MVEGGFVMEETEEQKLDREFDELNEAIVNLQIMERFEKENPEPEQPEDLDDLVGWEPWDHWHRDLCTYAEGWKDALKALHERQILERCLDDEAPVMTYFNFVWQFLEEYVNPVLESSRYWVLAREMIAFDSWKEEM
jgi:hypothetical protein